MTVWADADSLPREARDIIARRVASERRRGAGDFRAVFVANRNPGVREGGGVSFVLVGPFSGAADEAIMAEARPGDVVVTRDIPLAERIIAAHGDVVGVINDRGGRFSADSIRERRSIRDAMLELSLAGLKEPGGRSYGAREAGLFAKAFDAEIARLRKAAAPSGAEGGRP